MAIPANAGTVTAIRLNLPGKCVLPCHVRLRRAFPCSTYMSYEGARKRHPLTSFLTEERGRRVRRGLCLGPKGGHFPRGTALKGERPPPRRAPAATVKLNSEE